MADRDEHLVEQVKVVGSSGQISLGKRFAGKRLRVEYRDDGTILLVPVAIIPESQLWTLETAHATRIQRGLEWAAKNPARESDLDALEARAATVKGKRARRK